MKKKYLLLVPITLLLSGCNFGKQTVSYDPFMIGDNLNVVNSTEARLIANEAYNNLVYTTLLRKNSTNVTDDTNFYTGAFETYSTNDKTTTDSEVTFYQNKLEATRTVRKTSFIGNDSTVEDTNTSIEEWYGYKDSEETGDYSLLRKTVDKYNNISSTRFIATDDFSKVKDVQITWNKHIIETIDISYLTDVDISYSSDFIYVKDGQHIVGYYSRSTVSTEKSKIAPAKEEYSYVKRVTDLSVIDFYKDELIGIGWTVKSVSNKQVTEYLTSIDGKEANPIEVARLENVTSLFYERTHQTSTNIPEFEPDTSLPFFISQFKYNEEETELVFDRSYRLENNDRYYRITEDKFNGHAYYLEQNLSVGYYSFFNDEEETYEKWGYKDIIANKCVNYIIDPNPDDIDELPEINPEEENPEYPIDPAIVGHNKLFYVTEEATFSFRIVFDATMTVAREFTVAIVSK